MHATRVIFVPPTKSIQMRRTLKRREQTKRFSSSYFRENSRAHTARPRRPERDLGCFGANEREEEEKQRYDYGREGIYEPQLHAFVEGIKGRGRAWKSRGRPRSWTLRHSTSIHDVTSVHFLKVRGDTLKVGRGGSDSIASNLDLPLVSMGQIVRVHERTTGEKTGLLTWW